MARDVTIGARAGDGVSAVFAGLLSDVAAPGTTAESSSGGSSTSTSPCRAHRSVSSNGRGGFGSSPFKTGPDELGAEAPCGTTVQYYLLCDRSASAIQYHKSI